MFLCLLWSHIKITAEYKLIIAIVIIDNDKRGPGLRGLITRVHAVISMYHVFIDTYWINFVK